MSEIQRLPPVMNPNPVHPNAKSTTQITNGTTTTKSNIGSPVCRNCKTQTTPLWRRDETGQVLCNACGLFLKLHGRPRPISLKTDTIKSRNRIKQPNFSKSSGPNTPELKSKDSKVSIQPHSGNPQNGRHSPNSGKKRSPGSPMDAHYPQGAHSPLQPARAPFSGGFPSQMGPFHGNLPHQVQSLHYPSSTPTQFAPGLQRITSPLLLSTTPSMSNARSSTNMAANSGITSPPSSLTAMQAAGALENMSNELGPSASFKGANGPGQGPNIGSNPGSNGSSSGISLMNNAQNLRSESPALSTPSSALQSSPKPPSLPALGSHNTTGEKVLPSPSFGPQFHLSEPNVKVHAAENAMPALPPIQKMSGSAIPPQLPHLPTNLGSANYSSASSPENQPTPPQTLQQAPQQASQASQNVNSASAPTNRSSYGSGYTYPGTGAPSVAQSASGSGNTDNDNGGRDQSRNGQDEQDRNPHNNNNNNNNNAGSGSNSYEVNVLKTRISELELVNDLYRTRIMELEAMEQAARLRENSMRKRLDDLLRAQGYEDSSSMLNNTMRVLKREDTFEEDASKRHKSG
ncbi:hypothetical protein OY671_003432 [Metschnikowia pulcherrima]|nr:hypothetical protein OY671_003432 [Metschnikowia pulcherrima]